MSKEDLEKIYAELDAVIEALLKQAAALKEIKEKLASGGGPGEEKK